MGVLKTKPSRNRSGSSLPQWSLEEWSLSSFMGFKWPARKSRMRRTLKMDLFHAVITVCYTENVVRNRIRDEYKQWVILMSNVNRIYAGPSGQVVWGEGLRRWLETRFGHWCLSLVFIYFVILSLATSWSLIQAVLQCVCVKNKCMTEVWALQ